MAELAISTSIELVDKVIGFLSREIEHTFGSIDDIKTSLTTMRACLHDADGSGGQEVIKDLIKQMRQVAHDIEDLLDEFMLHAPHDHYPSNSFYQKLYVAGHNVKHWVPVHDIQSRMQNVRKRIDAIKASAVFSELVRRVAFKSSEGGSGSGLSFSDHEILAEDEIFGIEHAKTRLLDQVINKKQMRRRVIAVVGPAGSGKTVLVNSVFTSKEILGEFDCSAWVTVCRSSFGPVDVNDEFCQNLFAKFSLGKDKQVIPLANLGNHLRGKRYIVVLDNVRSEQQMSIIEKVLPNEPNDSRIIVTTTSSHVALWTDHIHEMYELPWKLSWSLFCKKAFRDNNGKCPPELKDLAQRIIVRCEGIPSAIATVGSLLSRKPPLPSEWEKVHDNLGHEIENATRDETISKMLLTGYKDLPSNLKSCFLYFTLFPEGYSVDRERLIRLWLAEGFVKRIGRKTPEEVAVEYLNELIEKNLVHPNSRDFDGRVKSCRVLNLVREFVTMKSEDENFAAVLYKTDSIQTREKSRRLSLHEFNLERIKDNDKLFNRLRTLCIFPSCKHIKTQIRPMCDQLKLLRVLDLRNAPLQHFPESICELTLLRYISLRQTSVREIPASIQALRYLEFLDLKQTQITRLPKAICTLHKLQHLLVSCSNAAHCVSFSTISGVEVRGSIRALQSLQKLTLVRANNDPQFFEELGHLDQLQKLGLVDLEQESGKHLCESIKKMQNLRFIDLRTATDMERLDLDFMAKFSPKLQRLYLKGRLLKLPIWINQSLSSLVRVHLEWSKLPDSPTETLQHLPNLMELHMVDAFVGEVLIFETAGFQKLKVLHIEQCQNLDIAVVYDGAMPNLQKLTFTKCMNLITLPEGIENLTRLEELWVYDMPTEFTARLKRGSSDSEMIKHIAEIHVYTLQDDGSWNKSRNS